MEERILRAGRKFGFGLGKMTAWIAYLIGGEKLLRRYSDWCHRW